VIALRLLVFIQAAKVRFDVFTAVRTSIFSPEDGEIETVCFSETLASANESTWRQDPEERQTLPNLKLLLSEFILCSCADPNWFLLS
jgi:hypothetical protein